MNTITEVPGVELDVQKRTATPFVVPIETAPVRRPATDRGLLVVLILCSVVFATMLVARVLIPAVHTLTSTSTQDYQQAP